jgi:hypothetical protein
MEGEVYGTRPEKDRVERFFLLDENEKFIKVQVFYHNVSYYIGNVLQSIPMIRGLRLFTTRGNASPSFDYGQSTVATEQFDGYTIGYVSGRSGLAIDQIQFHWYRMVNNR